MAIAVDIGMRPCPNHQLGCQLRSSANGATTLAATHLHVSPKSKNMIQEAVEAKEAAQYRRQMENAMRANTAEAVRHKKNLNAKIIPTTEITAREHRKRMATAKAAKEHGHLITMEYEHDPEDLIVTTDDKEHDIRILLRPRMTQKIPH